MRKEGSSLFSRHPSWKLFLKGATHSLSKDKYFTVSNSAWSGEIMYFSYSLCYRTSSLQTTPALLTVRHQPPCICNHLLKIGPSAWKAGCTDTKHRSLWQSPVAIEGGHIQVTYINLLVLFTWLTRQANPWLKWVYSEVIYLGKQSQINCWTDYHHIHAQKRWPRFSKLSTSLP